VRVAARERMKADKKCRVVMSSWAAWSPFWLSLATTLERQRHQH
jgi:hypothetical protein